MVTEQPRSKHTLEQTAQCFSAAQAHDIYGWGFFMETALVKASIQKVQITIKSALALPETSSTLGQGQKHYSQKTAQAAACFTVQVDEKVTRLIS